MKTQNTKLQFNKGSITELNDQQLTDVAGGGVSISIYIGRDDETQLEIDVTIFW